MSATSPGLTVESGPVDTAEGAVRHAASGRLGRPTGDTEGVSINLGAPNSSLRESDTVGHTRNESRASEKVTGPSGRPAGRRTSLRPRQDSAVDLASSTSSLPHTDTDSHTRNESRASGKAEDSSGRQVDPAVRRRTSLRPREDSGDPTFGLTSSTSSLHRAGSNGHSRNESRASEKAAVPAGSRRTSLMRPHGESGGTSVDFGSSSSLLPLQSDAGHARAESRASDLSVAEPSGRRRASLLRPHGESGGTSVDFGSSSSLLPLQSDAGHSSARSRPALSRRSSLRPSNESGGDMKASTKSLPLASEDVRSRAERRASVTAGGRRTSLLSSTADNSGGGTTAAGRRNSGVRPTADGGQPAGRRASVKAADLVGRRGSTKGRRQSTKGGLDQAMADLQKDPAVVAALDAFWDTYEKGPRPAVGPGGSRASVSRRSMVGAVAPPSSPAKVPVASVMKRRSAVFQQDGTGLPGEGGVMMQFRVAREQAERERVAEEERNAVQVDEYVDVHMRLSKALRPASRFESAQAFGLALEDWERDAKFQIPGTRLTGIGMTKEQCQRSLFQLASTWAAGRVRDGGPTTAADVAAFLRSLFERLTDPVDVPAADDGGAPKSPAGARPSSRQGSLSLDPSSGRDRRSSTAAPIATLPLPQRKRKWRPLEKVPSMVRDEAEDEEEDDDANDDMVARRLRMSLAGRHAHEGARILSVPESDDASAAGKRPATFWPGGRDAGGLRSLAPARERALTMTGLAHLSRFIGRFRVARQAKLADQQREQALEARRAHIARPIGTSFSPCEGWGGDGPDLAACAVLADRLLEAGHIRAAEHSALVRALQGATGGPSSPGSDSARTRAQPLRVLLGALFRPDESGPVGVAAESQAAAATMHIRTRPLARLTAILQKYVESDTFADRMYCPAGPSAAHAAAIADDPQVDVGNLDFLTTCSTSVRVPPAASLPSSALLSGPGQSSVRPAGRVSFSGALPLLPAGQPLSGSSSVSSSMSEAAAPEGGPDSRAQRLENAAEASTEPEQQGEKAMQRRQRRHQFRYEQPLARSPAGKRRQLPGRGQGQQELQQQEHDHEDVGMLYAQQQETALPDSEERVQPSGSSERPSTPQRELQQPHQATVTAAAGATWAPRVWVSTSAAERPRTTEDGRHLAPTESEASAPDDAPVVSWTYAGQHGGQHAESPGAPNVVTELRLPTSDGEPASSVRADAAAEGHTPGLLQVNRLGTDSEQAGTDAERPGHAVGAGSRPGTSTAASPKSRTKGAAAAAPAGEKGISAAVLDLCRSLSKATRRDASGVVHVVARRSTTPAPPEAPPTPPPKQRQGSAGQPLVAHSLAPPTGKSHPPPPAPTSPAPAGPASLPSAADPPDVAVPKRPDRGLKIETAAGPASRRLPTPTRVKQVAGLAARPRAREGVERAARSRSRLAHGTTLPRARSAALLPSRSRQSPSIATRPAGTGSPKPGQEPRSPARMRASLPRSLSAVALAAAPAADELWTRASVPLFGFFPTKSVRRYRTLVGPLAALLRELEHEGHPEWFELVLAEVARSVRRAGPNGVGTRASTGALVAAAATSSDVIGMLGRAATVAILRVARCLLRLEAFPQSVSPRPLLGNVGSFEFPESLLEGVAVELQELPPPTVSVRRRPKQDRRLCVKVNDDNDDDMCSDGEAEDEQDDDDKEEEEQEEEEEEEEENEEKKDQEEEEQARPFSSLAGLTASRPTSASGDADFRVVGTPVGADSSRRQQPDPADQDLQVEARDTTNFKAPSRRTPDGGFSSHIERFRRTKLEIDQCADWVERVRRRMQYRSDST